MLFCMLKPTLNYICITFLQLQSVIKKTNHLQKEAAWVHFYCSGLIGKLCIPILFFKVHATFLSSYHPHVFMQVGYNTANFFVK